MKCPLNGDDLGVLNQLLVEDEINESQSLLQPPPPLDDITELEDKLATRDSTLETTLSRLMESENHTSAGVKGGELQDRERQYGQADGGAE